MDTSHHPHHTPGFSLIELLIGVAIFSVLGWTIYQGLNSIFEATQSARLQALALAVANEHVELIRNLPYKDVGVIAGVPSGKIPPTKTVTRGGATFTIRSTIRNVDDPFDGTLGGSPSDLSPADYKLAHVDVSCSKCRGLRPVVLTTTVAPKNLETTTNNGALIIQVGDANGNPVASANVHIENNAVTPAINIDDVTNSYGRFELVDTPTSTESYRIIVTKAGYSTERTYPPNQAGNPNPVKSDATVAVQQVTQITFEIDRVSTLNVSSVSETCAAVGSIDFLLQGEKLIGDEPDVLKYSRSHATDASGNFTTSTLEWDTYSITNQDTAYDFAGTIPLLPFDVVPQSTQDFFLVVSSTDPRALLVKVIDSQTSLPLSNAVVTIQKGGAEKTATTSAGALFQTDWSGGSGQNDFTDATKYFSQDENIVVNNPTGDMRLATTTGNAYVSSGWLISSTFDAGNASTTYRQIFWDPQAQPTESGTSSVRFQIATNNDNTTWNFVGPDGTASTFYDETSPTINAVHTNQRYLRYKTYLQTANASSTPIVSETGILYSRQCTPPGQVFFKNLTQGDWDITITRQGYTTTTDTIDVGSDWQEYEAILPPE